MADGPSNVAASISTETLCVAPDAEAMEVVRMVHKAMIMAGTRPPEVLRAFTQVLDGETMAIEAPTL